MIESRNITWAEIAQSTNQQFLIIRMEGRAAAVRKCRGKHFELFAIMRCP